MDWRKRLGAAPAISIPDPLEQKEQKPPSGPDSDPLEAFATIARKIPEIEIEKMGECLHGRQCGYLRSEPPARSTCSVNDGPVFDLEACPLNHWEVKK